jgi:hypothetical protein
MRWGIRGGKEMRGGKEKGSDKINEGWEVMKGNRRV